MRRGGTDTGKRRRTFELQSERRLRARPEELTAIILDPEQLSHWGRAVFMICDVLDRGDERGSA